jgi:drug/metabolite transporter (DMT)-like permease
VLRPGTEAFQLASLLPLMAAVCYAALHTLTRKIGGTEGRGSLIFYIQVTFIVTSALIGLVAGHGGSPAPGDPSLEFLLRAGWCRSARLADHGLRRRGERGGGYAIGQAYRLSEAALVAPIEYAAMPMSVFWGWLVFAELPDGWPSRASR